MTTLTCPKCRQGLTDDALDVGQCPLCGFPFDGPMVLGAPGTSSSGTRLLVALGLFVLMGGAGVAGYVFGGKPTPATKDEVANRDDTDEPSVTARPVRYVAPMPHEPKHTNTGTSQQNPNVPPGDKGQPPNPMPPGPGDVGMPGGPVVELPKKDGPRPVAVMLRVDPKIEPKRHLDHPDDIAVLPDLNTNDRVVLTGRVRVLRIHSVNGKAILDASGLVAEEVEIRGDVNNEAQLTVNSPRGGVKIGGFVMGNAKLTIIAPGGLVTFTNTGQMTGSATATITTKRLETEGMLRGGSKVNVTLTAGGSLKITKAEEGATITYKQAAASDPPLVIEKGDFKGGARLVGGK